MEGGKGEAQKPLTGFHKRLYDAFVAMGVGTEVTLSELRRQLGCKPDEQQQLRKRIQELRAKGYSAHRTDRRRNREWLYVLDSATRVEGVASDRQVSAKVRAEILHGSGRRCQMCGKTVADDHVRLVVDHRIPLEWGGTNDADNLEAICEECNGGKKAYFASLPADAMKQCMSYDNSVQRIGELLKLFEGRVPPRRLLAAVAMEDEWPRRLRELRDLKWKVKCVRMSGERGAAECSYKLIESRPWPNDVRKAIKAAANARGAKSL